MSRLVKLPTREMGEVQLLLLSGWEKNWTVLKGTVFGDLLSVVSREAVDHALHGLSRPLVDVLGIPPEGALRKIPKGQGVCWHRVRRPGQRRACPIQGAECHLRAEKMPWCFEPTVDDGEVRRVASKVIELWRQGVYVVVVEEVIGV